MKEIYFEAYPRSGNTYFCDMIRVLSEKNNSRIKVYHHTHDIGELEEGLRKGIPCFTSIRNPLDACASLTVFSGKSCELSLTRYIEFYSFIESRLKEIKVFKFEDIVNDFNSVLEDLNLILDLDFEYYDVDSEVKDLIKNRAKVRHGQNADVRSGVPSDKRKSKLDAARIQLASEPLLNQATALYDKITATIQAT